MPGRRKRFDTLLAEHKNRARERERELHQPHSQQNPSLRDSHPSTQLISAHDTYQVAQGNGLAPDATKPLPLIKPKFHSPGLPRYVLQITRRPVLTHFVWLPWTIASISLQTKQQSWSRDPRRLYSCPRVTTSPSNHAWRVSPSLQWWGRERRAGGNYWQTGLSLFRLSPSAGSCEYTLSNQHFIRQQNRVSFKRSILRCFKNKHCLSLPSTVRLEVGSSEGAVTSLTDDGTECAVPWPQWWTSMSTLSCGSESVHIKFHCIWMKKQPSRLQGWD